MSPSLTILFGMILATLFLSSNFAAAAAASSTNHGDNSTNAPPPSHSTTNMFHLKVSFQGGFDGLCPPEVVEETNQVIADGFSHVMDQMAPLIVGGASIGIEDMIVESEGLDLISPRDRRELAFVWNYNAFWYQLALIMANLNPSNGAADDDETTGDSGWQQRRELAAEAPLVLDATLETILDIAANMVEDLVATHVFARKDNIMEQYACFANVDDVIVEFV